MSFAFLFHESAARTLTSISTGFLLSSLSASVRLGSLLRENKVAIGVPISSFTCCGSAKAVLRAGGGGKASCLPDKEIGPGSWERKQHDIGRVPLSLQYSYFSPFFQWIWSVHATIYKH